MCPMKGFREIELRPCVKGTHGMMCVKVLLRAEWKNFIFHLLILNYSTVRILISFLN